MKIVVAIKHLFLLSLAAVIAAVISGCTSTANVSVEHVFPDPVVEPRDIRVAVVFDKSFRDYIGKPNAKTNIALGQAQTDMLGRVFEGLFSEVQHVDSESKIEGDSELIITPSVVEVQLAVPSDTYLNVYEVWIKYKLDIRTADGRLLDSWFMPAYGKTTDSFMLSTTEAIRQASIVALRDAGAKLILDFYRVPAVASWMARNNKMVDQ